MAQRRSVGLWAGLWELPAVNIAGPLPPHRHDLIHTFKTMLGIEISSARRMTDINHILTHREITAWIYRGEAVHRSAGHAAAEADPSTGGYARLRWVSRPDELPLSVLAQKQLSALRAAEADAHAGVPLA
jgi:adenine-specific DNA glycosylase